MPVISSVPTLKPSQMKDLPEAARNRPATSWNWPMSAFAELIRVLRMAFVYSAADRRTQTLAITSAVSGEGNTTVSLRGARHGACGPEGPDR